MLAKFKDQIDAVYAADAAGSAQTEQASTRRNLQSPARAVSAVVMVQVENICEINSLVVGFPDLDNVDLRLLTRVA